MSKKSSRRWDIRHPDSTSNFWTKGCAKSDRLGEPLDFSGAPKREPRPRALGGVSGTPMYGFGCLVEGSVRQNTWACQRFLTEHPARTIRHTRLEVPDHAGLVSWD